MYRTKKIFLLEYIDYYGFDETDGENIESRNIIGYFTTQEKLNEAKALCLQDEISEKDLYVTEYNIKAGANQKFVYLLNYEYSIKVNDEYTDYYYYFEPQVNAKQCNEQKKQLLKESKYKKTPEKIYYDSPDGFYIDKIKLDYIAHIGYAVPISSKNTLTNK